ncbi:MAG TPA: RraA family protein [Devosiaceae bacterium]
MDEALLQLLKSVDTPTVCNAIEVAQGRRGFDRFTRVVPVATDSAGGAMVGFARTATIAAAAPAADPVEQVRALRMAYYRYVAEAPQPAVVVIQDIDPQPVGAYWGEINANVHKGFGIKGVLTNGLVRDLGDLPDDFPIFAGDIGVSHGFVHVCDIDVPVKVFGLEMRPGELVHADRHGALVVPSDVIPELADAIGRLHESEAIVLDAARAPGFDFARFEIAWAAFERSRT